MEERGGGGREGAARRWVIGALCVLVVAVVWLLAPQASAAGAGGLDDTFGTGGKVTTDFVGNGDQATAVAIQPDGKIVAAGGALGTTVDFALARYRPDGTLDTTFGAGGKVRTDFGSCEQAFAVAVQPDGKIVAAGGCATEFELARYNADGTLDGAFGAGGKVTTRFGLGLPLTRAHAIVLQPDGKIVVAGSATMTTVRDFGLARYNPNGTLDATFGSGGKVTTDIGGQDSPDLAWAVALQPDGKIVAAGSSMGPSGGDAFALARYTPGGSLDSTFGANGRVTTGFGGDQDWAQAVAVQGDGKIVAAGKTGNQCCLGTFNFSLARYNAGGTLDTAFGTGGKVTTDFDGGTDNAHALVVQTDGKLIAGGERLAGGNVSGASFDFALARYQPSGSLDGAFGPGGKVTTDFPGHNDHVYALALQQDGKVVAAGDSSPDFAVARYAATTVNNPPGASDDGYATTEDTPLTVPAPGVLANDTDADGDPTTAVLATGPAHGTVALNADGSFTYTPTNNFNGTDNFTYNANDGRADSNLATATITISEVNDPPTAVADSATLAEDATTLIDVTGNDTLGPANEAGQTLTVSTVGQPAHGQAAIISGGADAGKVNYTPVADYNGADTFTYTVCDDGTTNGIADPACDTASVSVTVSEVNDPPTAVADSATLAEDATTVIDVTGNDTPGPANEAGQTLTVSSVGEPAHGQAAIISGGADAGKVDYTPTADYNGPDSFTYTVCDNGTTNGIADPACDTASVAVTVTAANDAPIAGDDSYRTDEDTPLTVSAPGVLANDDDVDGDPVSVAAASVTAPGHGTVEVGADGSLTYTPTANFNGSDTFTYKASDGTDLSTPATVTITVVPVPDAPIAQSDSYGGKDVREDTPLTVAAPGVLANDSDPDGDPLTVAVVTGPAHGTLTLHPDGSFTYTPAANFNGRDTFTYKASDGELTSDLATATIMVLPVPDAPVAQDDSYSTGQDTPLTVAAPGVLANDSDADGDRLAAGLITGPAHGTLTLSSNGGFTYTPAAGFKGQDSFTYRAFDGGPAGDGATVTITVVPAPGNPVAQDDSYSTDQDTPLVVAAPGVLANDSDSDGDRLVVVMEKAGPRPAHGTLTLSTNGAFRYTPVAGFNGQDSFTYTASDGALTSNVATVTITVVPKVLFTSTRDGNAEIYVMNSEGNAVTRLTTNAAADTNPVWSPDHRRIVFTSTRDGNAEIYVMNADGTAQTRLTSNSGMDATPAWSPGGTKITFSRIPGDGNADIWVMNADGTGQTRLTINRAVDTTPAWSPDGQRIAFSSTRDGNLEIYVMPATGEAGCQNKTCTVATRLTTNPAIDTSPAWAATKIAFSSTRDGNAEIYVMNADGTAQTRLTSNAGIDATPAWSPDGQRIAFSSTRDDPNSEIYTMQADSTSVTRLTTNPASDTFPDW
jgi:uncharacterized delta-60 repeat protein